VRVRIADIRDMKEKAQPIPCITAYDYPTARIADEVGIPLVLVGDSLGNVVLGYDSTVPVTMEDMLHHVKAVVRGSRRALVVADMPFMSYQVGVEDALRNAGRMLQEGGAQAVKLEGGRRSAQTVRRLVEMGIPVMGHIGLTPQSVNQLSGYKVQGRSLEAAKTLVEDALILEESGVFSIVLESVPAPLARGITQRLSVPTIGIGAGLQCDGQIQVVHDVLGFTIGFVPKHAKQYANLSEIMTQAMRDYSQEVQSLAFPADVHAHAMDEKIAEQALRVG
jgi:3-methyl-2-oxobutanoate hydroxymethyltransferase